MRDCHNDGPINPQTFQLLMMLLFFVDGGMKGGHFPSGNGRTGIQMATELVFLFFCFFLPIKWSTQKMSSAHYMTFNFFGLSVTYNPPTSQMLPNTFQVRLIFKSFIWTRRCVRFGCPLPGKGGADAGPRPAPHWYLCQRELSVHFKHSQSDIY